MAIYKNLILSTLTVFAAFAAAATIDNFKFSGNTISTLNTNGDITLDPNGTGAIIFTDLTASTVPYLDSNKKLTSSATTPTELGRLSGVGSALCGISDSCTLTNKTIDADGTGNSITNIENADIKAAAGIVDTKLATISTAGKVSNSATTATSANTNSAIVARDSSGNFSAGTISAALTGNASTATAATALASDPSDCASNTYAHTIAASGNLTCSTVTNAGLAGSIAASKLVGTDIATVGTITSGTWTGTTIAVANGGTGITSGTSGGVLAYTASGTLASSGALTVNQLVKGGGAGAAPSTFTACSDGQIVKWASGVPSCGADSTGAGALGYRSVTGTDSTTASDGYVKLSGASFVLTLHTAVGNSGQILELGHQGTSLTQVYTLNTTSSQTIGGIASGSYKLVTNGETLKLISDGANWLIVSHQTNTDPVAYTPANTSTFSTNATWTGLWHREGRFAHLQGKVAFSGATNAATVNFLHVPASSSIDTSFLLGTTAGTFPVIGECVMYDSSGLNPVPGYAYYNATGDSTCYVISDVSGNTLAQVTTTVPVTIANGDAITYRIKVPMTGWQP